MHTCIHIDEPAYTTKLTAAGKLLFCQQLLHKQSGLFYFQVNKFYLRYGKTSPESGTTSFSSDVLFLLPILASVSCDFEDTSCGYIMRTSHVNVQWEMMSIPLSFKDGNYFWNKPCLHHSVRTNNDVCNAFVHIK